MPDSEIPTGGQPEVSVPGTDAKQGGDVPVETTSLGPDVEAQLAGLSPAGPGETAAPTSIPDAAAVQPEAAAPAGNTGEEMPEVGINPDTHVRMGKFDLVGTVANKTEVNDTTAGEAAEPAGGATESLIDKARSENELFEYARGKELDPKLALNDSDVAEALGKVWAAEGVVAGNEARIKEIEMQLNLANQRLAQDRELLGRKEQELSDAVKTAEKGATANNAEVAGDTNTDVSAASAESNPQN